MAYDTHDTAVMIRINRFILDVNKTYSTLKVAEKLEQAWSNNIKEREKNSTDPIGRDADYYFAARKELAKSTSNKLKFLKAWRRRGRIGRLCGAQAWVRGGWSSRMASYRQRQAERPSRRLRVDESGLRRWA